MKANSILVVYVDPLGTASKTRTQKKKHAQKACYHELRSGVWGLRSLLVRHGLLGGSWVVISRVTILITHTHEPPSRDRRGQTPNAELELSRVGFGCDYFEPLSANRQPTASIFGWLSKLWSLFGYPRY